jgi:hypothetical protein
MSFFVRAETVTYWFALPLSLARWMKRQGHAWGGPERTGLYLSARHCDSCVVTSSRIRASAQHESIREDEGTVKSMKALRPVSVLTKKVIPLSVRERRATMIMALLLSFLAVSVSSASAEAGSPWWHLASSERPTNLQAGVGRDEVQEVTVSATGGQSLSRIENALSNEDGNPDASKRHRLKMVTTVWRRHCWRNPIGP